MSGNAYTDKFMEKVPMSPVSQHIAALHAMAYWGGIYGSALEVFEHHLYSIGIYSYDRYRDSQPPYMHAPEVPHRPQRERRMLEGMFPETPMISPKVMTEAFAKMGEAVTAMKARLAQASSQPSSERTAWIKHQQRLTREREIGLAHVRTEAARVRRELGL